MTTLTGSALLTELKPSRAPSRLPPGVIVAGVDGIVRSVNEATCRTFGYLRSELVGIVLDMLLLCCSSSSF